MIGTARKRVSVSNRLLTVLPNQDAVKLIDTVMT
jgi:hypothetical protein